MRSNSPVVAACERSIEAGIHFLLGAQAAQGHWTDWQLPPGHSRMWTTAYTGFRLATLPDPFRQLSLARLDVAAEWLIAAELAGGGWGYNEQVGPDADSTALGILFLHSLGIRPKSLSYDRLRTFQREDGGFATYTHEQSFGAWIASHCDVTALALPALLTAGEPCTGCLDNTGAYVMKQATPAGLWNSYWWQTPLYSTEAHLRWLVGRNHALPREKIRNTLLHIQPTDSFETALLLLCLSHLHHPCDACEVSGSITSLLHDQLADGSWPAEPKLRLPSRDCYEPWLLDGSAVLYADQNRIFTSATVIAALSAALASQS